MEIELEPRVKPLPYKVKATSRESTSQKATHVLDTDLRNHWSTATNTKEWILLELDEPCLLSHIRIYNKSVLEWEISVGLRYKPETFVKVRPRCEAPRRDMIYPTNYTPTRYVRISCLRGNPIALFFIELIGVSVAGLESEFQPVVNHLLPHIISHKQEAHDMHLQLLQEITSRLVIFLPQLEADLNSFSDAAEPNTRFLAMLAGPFYPILHIVNERETARLAGHGEPETSKNSPPSSTFTVSSNFESRRSRNASPLYLPTSSSVVFRPDVIFSLLRKAYQDSHLGTVCRMACRILMKLVEPIDETFDTTVADVASKSEPHNHVHLVDYSNLFGDEFCIPDDPWDSNYLNLLDIKAVEEGILHVLYACASQPLLCSKLADDTSDFWSALPLVQALLPALRPTFTTTDMVDDSFSQWKQPFVQHALSQIVATSSSSVYRPLLHACAGYLSSYSPSHARAACVLIDLCSGLLAPWIAQVLAKVDLAMELLEDLLGVIQGARHSLTHARAALNYIVLALSGHMDDIMPKYKEVKHQILFLIEMLEPFLDPAITPLKRMIAFGNVSPSLLEKQEQTCLIALNVIHTAVIKSAILPSLESEWKRGSVAPSVLLSVLEPHIQLPPDIDRRKVPLSETTQPKQLDLISEEDSEGKTESSDSSEDIALLFAPQELKNMQLSDVSVDKKSNNPNHLNSSQQEQVNTGLGSGYADECSNLNLDYSQLMNYRDCELLASEFRRLASDLHAQNEVTLESHNASINALLLAAECYVNPFFVMSFKDFPRVNHTISQPCDYKDLRKILTNNNTNNMEHVAHLERKRDKVVIQILLEAAKLEMEYKKTASNDEQEESLDLSDADAITLVRQNQALICEFLIQRLQKEKNSGHEILIQSLVFLLHSATKLHCSPEDIIDIILESAEHFNLLLTSLYHQFKEGNLQLYRFRVHEIQRKWMLLQSLVIASSGNEEDQISKKTGFFHFSKLVPSSVWMYKINFFASSPCPIIRFLGWMAVSRNANQYKKEKLFLTSNLSDLTVLLSIFADDLAVVERNAEQYLHNLYPDICLFLPNTKKEFESFGEIILEAVGLQLRSLSSSIVPDILCWFSDLCLWPFSQKSQNNLDLLFKGFVAKNAKAIILYVLESIIIEHMEAIVPEIPRVVQVLVSLCKASYCDVDFLESILRLLKPIISYSLRKVSEEEKESDDKDSCLTFEYLCFEELFSNIRFKNEDKEDKSHSKALTIYILASVFTDLSFLKKREILQSLVLCADFALFDSTTSCYDYICAFQSVLDSCKGLLVENLRARGALPLKIPLDSDINSNSNFDEISKIHPWFPDYVISNQMGYSLSDEEVMNFSNDLEDLISELNPTIELCWKLHHVLAKKLALTSSQCYMYSKILSSIAEYASISPEGDCVTSLHHWKISLKELTETILVLQDKNCWEIASIILDSVLEMPRCFDLSNVIGSICKSIDKFSSIAPKITWRLQSDKWLSNMLTRGAHTAQGSETPLVNLLCKMLGHTEPEQRFIALQHLGKLVGQDSYGGAALTSSLDLVVSGTWDRVAVLAASDSSLHLRTRAILLLLDYVPFAERRLLQSVLISADCVLHDLKSLADNNCEGPLIRVSLALIAHVCLYSPSEDISLIPQSIWRNIESLGNSETERKSGDVERKACHALCRLKNEGDKAKEILKEVLATTSSKEVDPDFGSTRESILQVLANLTSVQSYFDVFSKQIDQKDMELEEAELEIDLLQKEQALRDSSNDVNDWCQLPFLATYAKKDDNRLQQIKDSIQSLEKAKLKEEIIARRQKKLLVRQERQMHLEEAALRETELLQKLDSERTSEVEREIQRQQMLEIERAKTRELRHNLEIEKEKQSQRELQRELEQAESGIRPSRREFPSSHSSRGRDRFRERENNRQSNEVNTRTSSAGSHSEQGNAPSSSMTGAPAVILSGSSRTYTGQTPTILQPSRDRQDDGGGGSGYEEGSRDSGDTGSVGDPDLVSALEGQAGGFGSGQRHGSRGGKARQIMERREREGGGGGGGSGGGGGRREGKWERKH